MMTMNHINGYHSATSQFLNLIEIQKEVNRFKPQKNSNLFSVSLKKNINHSFRLSDRLSSFHCAIPLLWLAIRIDFKYIFVILYYVFFCLFILSYSLCSIVRGSDGCCSKDTMCIQRENHVLNTRLFDLIHFLHAILHHHRHLLLLMVHFVDHVFPCCIKVRIFLGPLSGEDKSTDENQSIKMVLIELNRLVSLFPPSDCVLSVRVDQSMDG